MLHLSQVVSLFFTFHNVSIKTGTYIRISRGWISLHSTMFLLKPVRLRHNAPRLVSFTFHNVSINTRRAVWIIWRSVDFTFHNVSIKTAQYRVCELFLSPLHSTMFLLKLLHFHIFSPVHFSLHSTMFLLKPG